MSYAYISTRSAQAPIPCDQAILQGLAPDGGLYVPDMESPTPFAVSTSYVENMNGVLERFFGDLPLTERLRAVEASVARFSHPDVTPLIACGEDATFLELFHGPTGAFKDVALTLLPHLMKMAASRTDIEHICILTATSGDTGSAAMEGFANVPGTSVLTLYPNVGTSEIQRRQMTCCLGDNVSACAIEGNFDDAQAAAKAAFLNTELQARAKAKKCILTSANSINIGRLFPQVCYYLTTSARLNRPFDVVVPTGNFGNILAAWYARLLGAKIERLAIASNTNHVLFDMVKTGCIDTRRDFHITNSPSMDILVSSNLERLLWLLSGKDGACVSAWQQTLASQKHLTLPPHIVDALQNDFPAGWATNEETETAIREVWERHHYLLDPHTAIGWKVARENHLHNPVIAATATPWKFPRTVLHALTGQTIENDFRAAEELARITGEAPRFTHLETASIRHAALTTREDVTQHICEAFGF